MLHCKMVARRSRSWTATVQQVRAKQARTAHGACKFYIDENGLIVKSKATSAPPRAGTTGISCQPVSIHELCDYQRVTNHGYSMDIISPSLPTPSNIQDPPGQSRGAARGSGSGAAGSTPWSAARRGSPARWSTNGARYCQVSIELIFWVSKVMMEITFFYCLILVFSSCSDIITESWNCWICSLHLCSSMCLKWRSYTSNWLFQRPKICLGTASHSTIHAYCIYNLSIINGSDVSCRQQNRDKRQSLFLLVFEMWLETSGTSLFLCNHLQLILNEHTFQTCQNMLKLSDRATFMPSAPLLTWDGSALVLCDQGSVRAHRSSDWGFQRRRRHTSQEIGGGRSILFENGLWHNIQPYNIAV